MDSYIKPFSFEFNGRNSRTDFGLIASSYDFLLPEKRQRKVQVPLKHGSYDFSTHDGKKIYNERILRLHCAWVRTKSRTLARHDVREISFWLSQRGKIVLDIEPDKYYIGEIYDGNEFTAQYNYSRTESSYGEFEIDFICEPFAYGGLKEEDIREGMNKIEYKGTAETPCLIILRNKNSYELNNIQITLTKKRGK